MAEHTNHVVPPYDFTAALRLSPEERLSQCVARVRDRLRSLGVWDSHGVPPVPDTGAAEDEIRQLETELGVALPGEYRLFLSRWRYLLLADGMQVWGFDHEGLSIGRPWTSEEHLPGVRYLVFADYWGYADGDQLLFEVGDPAEQVVAYLHEHGPLYERFAPSFSTALWRMVEETERMNSGMS